MWVALGVMLLVLTVVAIAGNVVFDTMRTDRGTYFIGFYVAAWILFVLAYGILTLWAFRHRDRTALETVVRRSQPTERRTVLTWLIDGGGAMSWTVQVAVLSVVIIVVLMTNERYRTSVVMTLGGGLVVAMCWLMMVISYAVQYAREDIRRPGLEFAGSEPPVFDDYLYQAITVSTSLAVSDVTATTTRMRRLVRSHGLVAFAFAFNTVIVSLLVSLLTIAVG